jgi:hypothetical protein
MAVSSAGSLVEYKAGVCSYTLINADDHFSLSVRSDRTVHGITLRRQRIVNQSQSPLLGLSLRNKVVWLAATCSLRAL